MIHQIVFRGIEISGKRIASKVIEGVIVATLVSVVTEKNQKKKNA